MNIKVRLALMNFLEFAIWGAYLTSMGRYLGEIGFSSHIGLFYSMQGIVSLFMPALIGIIADKWIPAQRLLGLSHLLAGVFLILAGLYGMQHGTASNFFVLFTLYSLSVAFYMPTLALTNSVAYNALAKVGLDSVKVYPPIRVFGTVGFILSMWFVDILGFQVNYNQFFLSGTLSLVLSLYAITLPMCPISRDGDKKSMVEALGLKAFSLFKRKQMSIFFIFSMLLGVSLQITNGFANPFISSFGAQPQYVETFGVKHANILISLSQISETFCILLIPFFMKRFGIKKVMLIAMIAWALRFTLFGLGNPGSGVWMFVFSMIVYGVAFDFFNISGSLFVDTSTETSMRSSAQGLFVLMTNGVGATIGTLGAQAVINTFTTGQLVEGNFYIVGNWRVCWLIFAAYALIIGVCFALVFNPKEYR